MKRNVSEVCVCFVAISALVLDLLKNAGFGGEWDTLYICLMVKLSSLLLIHFNTIV